MRAASGRSEHWLAISFWALAADLRRCRRPSVVVGGRVRRCITYREQGGFGNAILSRSAFRSVHQRQLLPPSLYDGTEPTEPRAVLLAELVDSSIVFGSTHFPRYDSELRHSAGRRLVRLLDALERSFLICGDFNQPADSWMTGSIVIAPAGAPPTYPTTEPVEAIDYVLVKDVAVVSATAEDNRASDHYPVGLKLRES